MGREEEEDGRVRRAGEGGRENGEGRRRRTGEWGGQEEEMGEWGRQEEELMELFGSIVLFEGIHTCLGELVGCVCCGLAT